MDKGGTQRNGLEDKKLNDNAQVLIFKRYHRQIICVKKEDEEDLPSFKTASMHRYKDSTTTFKRAKTNYSNQ